MGVYEQIESNRRKSFLLVVFFVLFISFVGYLFGVYTGFSWFGLIFALVLSMLLVLAQYYNGDKWILRMSGVREPTKKENAYLINTVEGLAIAAGVPTPKVYIIEDTAPNAFATGRDPKHASIVVTTGLLQKMNRSELEGVIGHEMSHVKNFDTRYMMLVVVMVAVIVFLSDWFWRMSWRSRGNKEDKGSLVIIAIAIFLAIFAPLIAYLVRFAASRRREYLADADGALLTRNPEELASALEKISKDKEPLEAANKGTAPLYIINPLKNYSGKINNLFSTHPPLEERVKRLREM